MALGCILSCLCFFFFQAEDGIRDLVRSRGLGDVYKRQRLTVSALDSPSLAPASAASRNIGARIDGQQDSGLSLIHI